MAGVVKFWGPYPYRSAFHATDEAEECERALAHLADVLMVEGAQHRRRDHARDRRRHQRHPRAAARLPGRRARAVRPSRHRADLRRGDGRLRPLRRVVRRSRSGASRPDLVCFAKGVNSGYLPLGGVVIGRHVADTFRDRAFPGGLTYSGHPLACASAVASINIFQRGGHHRARPHAGHRRHRARARQDQGQAPQRRRGPRPRRVLGDRAGDATSRPASRSCRSTPPAPTPSRWPTSPRRARRRACGRSRTSTACTSCRRATRRSTRCTRAWPSSTRRSPSPTSFVTG